jgi:nitrite reductase (NADH) small subunit
MRPIVIGAQPASNVAASTTIVSFISTSGLQTRAGARWVSPYNGDMPFLKIGTLAQLPPDSVMEVMVGDQPYAICNVGGTVRALSGVCIHRGGPLGQGQLNEGRVVCPYHLWEFDCATGEYDYDPTRRAPTYEVKVEAGDIFIQVP